MEEDYYCPLLNKVIQLGLCMDINYERTKIANFNILPELGINKEEADQCCTKCPHLPFKK
ncbi:hypothetical protein [Paenibacillus riograndensis]|uniref:Uncharacterized protein n=1 Tax=Paenibacillus riograndensis SBR5 TaxID=1073571 RepID=A0A0E4CYU0_9BACL|nr:hypothetical protein [Paenibacillus riograndensis]CQR57801.1 hypothetical protein PRIO_5412 [Paenibacillus riograndensis SBR5]